MAFPRLPSSSAVDLTLSEETKSSYAEMLATARQNVPLAEVGTKRVTIKEAMAPFEWPSFWKFPGIKRKTKHPRLQQG